MDPTIRKPAEGRAVAVVGDVYRFLATGSDFACKPRSEADTMRHHTRLGIWLLMIAGAGISLVGQYSPAQEPREWAKRDAHGEVICMAITADGKTLATGTWDRLTLWDVASGKELH